MSILRRRTFKMGPLPLIALRSILLHVRHQGQGHVADLLTYALVNRAWHDAAMPILYGIVSLDLIRLKLFTRIPLWKDKDATYGLSHSGSKATRA